MDADLSLISSPLPPFTPSPLHPIAIFDSGVGGLSVLRHIRAALPYEELIYFADQAHVPYGPRAASEIRALLEGIIRGLVAEPVKAVVIACNTASAAALDHLRVAFPELPIVGMEPAVKPGAAQTNSGKVGVLATPSTLGSERYEHLLTRFAGDVEVFEDPCVGLVELIEAGRVEAPETVRLLRQVLRPMLAEGVDTLVLGCTHYPFVMPLIAEIAGAGVTLIDPAPAVARQAERVLRERGLLREVGNNDFSGSPETTEVVTTNLITTGDPGRLAEQTAALVSYRLPVTPAYWQDGRVVWSH